MSGFESAFLLAALLASCCTVTSLFVDRQWLAWRGFSTVTLVLVGVAIVSAIYRTRGGC